MTQKKYIDVVNFGLILMCVWMALSCKKDTNEGTVTALEVQAFYPNSGKGLSLITIQGRGFSMEYAENKVTFNGVSAEVISVNDEELVVQAPLSGSTGMIHLEIGSQSVDVGTYTYQDLSIEHVSKQKGIPGDVIMLTGYGFQGDDSPPLVTINDSVATIVSISDTELKVSVPSNGSGKGPIKVSIGDKSVTGPDFQYVAFGSFYPKYGGPGTKITITGSGFSDVKTENIVHIGYVGQSLTQLEVLEASTDTLIALVPEDIVQIGRVYVTIGDMELSSPNLDEFWRVDPPEITAVSPLNGLAGTEVVIEGKNFTNRFGGKARVWIGVQEIVPNNVSSKKIVLEIPEGIGRGIIVVDVEGQAVEGPEFLVQALGIHAVWPSSGLAGTKVSITGTGFSTNIAENSVLFNGKQAVITAATDTELQVLVPEGVTSGYITAKRGAEEFRSPEEFRRAGAFTLASALQGLKVSSSGGSLTADKDGNVYVLDIDHHTIQKVSASGQVSLLAGSGSAGNKEGNGTQASFSLNANSGVVFAADGNLYLTDSGNRTLRRISLQGQVTTVYRGFESDIGKLAVKDGNELFVLTASGYVSCIYTNATIPHTTQPISKPFLHVKPAVDNSFNIYSRYNYLEDSNEAYQHMISFSGRSGVLYDNWLGFWESGYADGIGKESRFDFPMALDMYDVENFLVLDQNNHALRKVDIATQNVTTLFKTEQGFADGDVVQAKFSNTMSDMTVAPDGTVYILDNGNNAVRKVYVR